MDIYHRMDKRTVAGMDKSWRSRVHTSRPIFVPFIYFVPKVLIWVALYRHYYFQGLTEPPGGGDVGAGSEMITVPVGL